MKNRMTIKGQKIWRDLDNANGTRPASIRINLMRDGELYQSTVIDSAGDGVYYFACLPKWKNYTHKYYYQVDEAVVPTGYIRTIEGYNVINTLGIARDEEEQWPCRNSSFMR